MKKLALSAFVVMTFIVYSFHERQDGSPAVVKPIAPQVAQTTQTTQPAGGSSTGSSNSTGSGSSAPPPAAAYKDGQYTGSVADAFYGFVQIEATISGGRLTDVRFLQHPSDNPNSVAINSQAMPYLKQEALQAQSANVNIVSGATDTSQAFIQSLSAALNNARS